MSYNRTSNRQGRLPTVQTQVTSVPGKPAEFKTERTYSFTSQGQGTADQQRQWWAYYNSLPNRKYGKLLDPGIQAGMVQTANRGVQIKTYVDTTTQTKQATAPELRFKRDALAIEKGKEGKQDLVEDVNKPLQATAEDILKRRLALIRMKGRASMPGSQGATKDEPTVNVSSGGAIGLNFT